MSIHPNGPNGLELPGTVRSSSMNNWVLTMSCADQPGIVHRVTGGVVQAAGNITELAQFSSVDSGRFFMRIQLDSALEQDQIEGCVTHVMEQLEAHWQLDLASRPTRALILVSKAAHCLNDLLFRQRSGQLNMDIGLILANHPDLAQLADFYDVPFEEHVVLPDSKAAFEDRIRQVVDEQQIELVVLARYMQILSPELCRDLAGRAINIHHSFLPGFKGANPYRQAHTRGVKLIGATAHFVTSDLDEGPIIEQNVTRVDHTRSPAELMAIGQDEESQTLSEAVKLYAEKRVFLDGSRTVIFR